uniref:BLOC-1-related complex subunit 7 n=1 Tax=Crassostrea virginica TaxID=6565 RepID=A0A8B8EZ23_CRAVI|nr:BLOC-1-related complex subunit 7-like isoform X3 [Crassostrea virginica]
MNWNQETKTRLNEKVAQNVQDVGSLVRHVVKTSRSSESLKKMVTIKTQLEYQESAIERSVHDNMSTLSDIQGQLNSINR